MPFILALTHSCHLFTLANYQNWKTIIVVPMEEDLSKKQSNVQTVRYIITLLTTFSWHLLFSVTHMNIFNLLTLVRCWS